MTAPERPSLSRLGWDPDWNDAFAPLAAQGLVPARVCREHRGLFRLWTETGEVVAELLGRLRHTAATRSDLPAVGDFVGARTEPHGPRALIHAVVPRRGAFVRRAAGEKGGEQVVAANVDTVFLVSGLDRDYNPRRIERYLATAWDSGARPVILLNKPDLCEDVAGRAGELEALAPGVPVHVVSGRDGGGLPALEPYLRPGQTVALLGSSGVGKSSLINRLLGAEVLPTRSVRESDQRGRHTTSHRQMIALPGGALVIDTPGMRELQLFEAAAGVSAAFEDVAALAEGCRFRDCRHASEPGCAVRAAVESGALAEGRLTSFHKLRQELEHQARRHDPAKQADERRRWRTLHRAGRRHTPRG